MSDKNPVDPTTSPVAPAVPAAPETPTATPPKPPKPPTGGTRKTKEAAAPTHYQVVAGQLGPHAEGAVLPADMLKGADIQRLLGLGVLAPTAAPAPADEEEE